MCTDDATLDTRKKREKADKNLQNVYIKVYNYNARCREKIKTVSNSIGELNSLMIAGS